MASRWNIASERPTRIGRPTVEEAAGLECRILAAAWDLLLAKGPGDLSIERIAQAAGVSKKTIYTRFRNRNDLMLRLLEQRLAMEADGLTEDLRSDDFRDAFCGVGERILTFLTSPERQAIGAVLMELPAARRDAWTTTYAVGLRAIDALLEHPKARAACALVDPAIFRHAFLQCLIGHAENVLRAPDVNKRRNAEWMRDLARLFLRT